MISEWLEIGDSKVDRFSVGSNKEIAKKSEKSKGQELSKSQKSESKKLAKSKKPSKIGNLFKFDIKKVGLNILTSNAKMIFNYLRLIFIKASIL